MMGLGVTVRGASSSSSSLSASAPPFTVESSVSKSKSNTLVSVKESSYISAPHVFHNPNAFSSYDREAESFGAPYLSPTSNDQLLSSFSVYSSNPQFHALNKGSVSPTNDAFNFQYVFDKMHDAVESSPYHSHYVGHVANDEAPLVSLAETKADFLSNTCHEPSIGLSLHDGFSGNSFGLECTPQGHDYWNGDGKVEQALQKHDVVSGHDRNTSLTASSYLHKDYRLGDYPVSSKLDASSLKKDVGLMSRESQIQFPGLEPNHNNKIGAVPDQSYRSFFGESSGMSSTFERSHTTMPKIGLVSTGYNNMLDSPNMTHEKEQQLMQDIDSLRGYNTNIQSFYTKKDDHAFDLGKAVDKDYTQHKTPPINIPKGYSSDLGNITVGTENTSDCYIPAVDSPCWKGASASRIFPSEDYEVSNTNYLKKKAEGSCFPDSQVKGTESLSCEDNGGNHNEYLEQIFTGNEKLNENKPMTKEPNLNFITSESCDFTSNNGLDSNVTEGASSLSAKEFTENTENTHSSTKSLPKLNTQMLVNSICNLSELLMFQASTDPKAISEKDCEDIRNMISNLDEFLLKKTGPVLNLQKCSQDHLKEVSLVSGKNVDRILPEKGDMDSLKDNSIIGGLKEVLSKNFNDEEELHPQTVLYKNLWLEAESTICAMNVKARFNRMKHEMDIFKSNTSEMAENSKFIGKKKERTMDQVKNEMDRFKSNPLQTAESSKIVGKKKETTTVDRLKSNPLQTAESSKIVGKKELQETIEQDVEASVMARFQILKCREDAKTGGHEQIDDRQHLWKNRVLHYNGKSDNSSSSDWEHVLKDELA